MCFVDMCAFKSILKSTERVEEKGLSMGEEVERAVFFFMTIFFCKILVVCIRKGLL